MAMEALAAFMRGEESAREPVVTKRSGGEYSTALIGDYIETIWFPTAGDVKLIDRTYIGLSRVAADHIAKYEN